MLWDFMSCGILAPDVGSTESGYCAESRRGIANSPLWVADYFLPDAVGVRQNEMHECLVLTPATGESVLFSSTGESKIMWNEV